MLSANQNRVACVFVALVETSKKHGGGWQGVGVVKPSFLEEVFLVVVGPAQARSSGRKRGQEPLKKPFKRLEILQIHANFAKTKQDLKKKPTTCCVFLCGKPFISTCLLTVFSVTMATDVNAHIVCCTVCVYI